MAASLRGISGSEELRSKQGEVVEGLRAGPRPCRDPGERCGHIGARRADVSVPLTRAVLAELEVVPALLDQPAVDVAAPGQWLAADLDGLGSPSGPLLGGTNPGGMWFQVMTVTITVPRLARSARAGVSLIATPNRPRGGSRRR
jgi:hypothetical protein